MNKHACRFALPLFLATFVPFAQLQAQEERSDVARAMEAERAAEIELAVGAIRLTLLRARTQLVRDHYDDAIELAWKGLEATHRLPDDVDRESLVGDLEQVIVDARAERGGRKASSEDPTRQSTSEQELIEAQRELEQAREGKPEYVPGVSDISDVDAELRDEARIRAQADLDRAYKTDEADLLARGGHDRRIPDGMLVFPQDWKQRRPARAGARNGIMYEGPAFKDADGQLKQTVVYDIQSLVFPVPQFRDFPVLDLRVTTREIADRDALRFHSEIFSGYARDLAAGLPLLVFFGGIDDVRSMSMSGTREQEQLSRMVEEVLANQPEPDAP